MKKAAVVKFFGSQIAVAKALNITKSAVSQWPEIVPLKSALRVQSLTAGQLPVDMALYHLPALPSRTHQRAAM